MAHQVERHGQDGRGDPDEVDLARVAEVFPYGDVRITPVAGGMRMPNGTDYGPGQDHLIIAVAVVAVGVPPAD